MRIRFRIASLVAAIALVGIAGSAFADGDKIQLRLHLKAGQKFGLKGTDNSTIGINSPGGIYINVNTSESIGLSFHVNSVDTDGTAHMDAVCKYIRTTVALKNEVITYDSSNPSSKNSPLAAVYSSLLGQKIPIVLSPDGKVSGASGLASAVMKGIFEHNYPPNPVAVGERWSQTVTENSLPYVANVYMKITDRSGGTCNVKVYADLKSKPQDSSRTYGGMTVKMLISGIQQGNMTVDEDTGLITGGSMSGQATGNCEVSGSTTTRGQITVSNTSTL